MEILGVRIDNLTMNEVLHKIQDFLRDGRQHYIVTVNPEFIVKAQKDREFCEILNNADLAIADGIGVIWASRIGGKPLKERVAGADLVKSLKFKVKSFRVFLLGGYGVAEKIASEWPAVVGFSEETESMELFAQINQCQPGILLVALGAPKQEKWIAENLRKLPSVKVAIGVGGAFDMISGKIKRAPRFMQEMRLEWFWRLIKEPRRLPRIFNAIVFFPWLVLKSKIKS